MTPFLKWLNQVLNCGYYSNGSEKHYIKTQDHLKTNVYESYVATTKDKYSTNTKFWMDIKEIFPGLSTKRKRVNKVLTYVIDFPTIEECRGEFRKRMTDKDWVFDEADEEVDEDEFEEKEEAKVEA
jgi:hypothetical protein